MSARDEPDHVSGRQEMEARNAALRGQIDDMLSDLRQRTRDLQEKQAEAADRTHEVTSEDGLVTATVDAAGTLRELTLAPKSFERCTPERLARTVTSVIREASGTARQSLQAEFAPLSRAPEPPNPVDGAPAVPDFLTSGPLVPAPDPAAERAQRTGTEPPRSEASSGSARDWEDEELDDEVPESFMRGDPW